MRGSVNERGPSIRLRRLCLGIVPLVMLVGGTFVFWASMGREADFSTALLTMGL
jgi:hypothetical protein